MNAARGKSMAFQEAVIFMSLFAKKNVFLLLLLLLPVSTNKELIAKILT